MKIQEVCLSWYLFFNEAATKLVFIKIFMQVFFFFGVAPNAQFRVYLPNNETHFQSKVFSVVLYMRPVQNYITCIS
jgi:hypothetical protein